MQGMPDADQIREAIIKRSAGLIQRGEVEASRFSTTIDGQARLFVAVPSLPDLYTSLTAPYTILVSHGCVDKPSLA